MKNRQYQGVQLSKKENELIQFLQSGSNVWVEAFYLYKQRRRAFRGHFNKEQSWFNRTLKMLHLKGLCKQVPFVNHHWSWRNPGVEASKANLMALSIQETNHDKGSPKSIVHF